MIFYFFFQSLKFWFGVLKFPFSNSTQKDCYILLNIDEFFRFQKMGVGKKTNLIIPQICMVRKHWNEHRGLVFQRPLLYLKNLEKIWIFIGQTWSRCIMPLLNALICSTFDNISSLAFWLIPIEAIITRRMSTVPSFLTEFQLPMKIFSSHTKLWKQLTTLTLLSVILETSLRRLGPFLHSAWHTRMQLFIVLLVDTVQLVKSIGYTKECIWANILY